MNHVNATCRISVFLFGLRFTSTSISIGSGKKRIRFTEVETSGQKSPMAFSVDSKEEKTRPAELAAGDELVSFIGRQKIQRIVAMMQDLCEDTTPFTIAEVTQIITAAYCAVDEDYTAERARAWGQSFDFKTAVGDGDLQRFIECGRDIKRMTDEEHSRYSEVRLSVARVNALVPKTHPDYLRILELADEGIHIPTDPSFQSVSTPPPFRRLYLQVAPAVNWLYYDEWSRHKCFILPTEEARSIEDAHFANVHWTKKDGTDSGRKLADHSDISSGHALNAGTSSDQAKERYGQLSHPSITSIIRMVLEVVEEFGWGETMLFKSDLKDAFGLLKVRKEDVHLLMSELTDGLTVVATSGLFGLTGMPPTFGVISRVIESGINACIRGKAKVYADDTLAATGRAYVVEDLNKVVDYCEGLLGDKAVSKKKNVTGRAADFIGWRLDLDTRLVTLTSRNFNKLLYGFCSVDMYKPVPVRTLMQLSGRAARYTMVLRQLKALTGVLFAAHCGQHGKKMSRNISLSLKPEAQMAIEVWRASIVLLGLAPGRFARTMESFLPQNPAVTIQFDSSLQGMGLLLTDDLSGGFMGGGRAAFPFELGGDSSHQNTCEFIAVVLGLIAIARSGRTGIAIRLIGDSTTALKWSKRESWHGELSQKAAIIFLLFAVAFDIHVEEAEHILGVHNVECDGMSRGLAPQAVGVPADRVIELEGHEISLKVLSLCDPRVRVQSGDSFMCLWKEVQQCIRAVKEELGNLDRLPLWADKGISSPLAAKPFSPLVYITSPPHL